MGLLHVQPGEPPDRRMLSDVDAGAHRTLPVDEERQRERKMCHGVVVLLRTLVRLNEPFSQPDEVAREQTSLDQVVQGFEQQRPALVGQAALPRALFAVWKKQRVRFENWVTCTGVLVECRCYLCRVNKNETRK